MEVRCFIALMLSIEVEAYANQVMAELHDRYRTRTAKAPPHITLQPPFLQAPDAIPLLERHLASFAQQQSIVPIQVSGVGSFRQSVLYLNVVRTPELLSLQAALMEYLETHLQICDPVSQRRAFAPHITVASRNLTRSTFRDAKASLQERPIEFQFVCDRLTLLTYDQGWQIRSEFGIAN